MTDPRSIELGFLYIGWVQNQNSFSLFSLYRKVFSLDPNTLFSLKTSYPRDFRPNLVSNHLVCFSNLSFLMHLDLGFVFSRNFWGFCKLLRFWWNFWVRCCLFDAIWSCIAFHLHFHNVSCIIDVCWLICELCAVRFGLGWTHDVFIFNTSHVHAFFHASVPFLFTISVLGCDVVFLFFSLSLSLGYTTHGT